MFNAVVPKQLVLESGWKLLIRHFKVTTGGKGAGKGVRGKGLGGKGAGWEGAGRMVLCCCSTELSFE